MHIITDIEPARQIVRDWQHQGDRVGLVPTMGALHEGHLSLIRASKSRCDRTAVTIFVNPTQFGPREDYNSYPRVLGADWDKCKQEDVDLVFAPGQEEMYPGGTEQMFTTVHVGRLTEHLCGLARPGHFDGVATVVTKLFNILPTDAAFFGEKDYQQLVMIRRIVQELNIPIEIVGCPIVREPDGLAMSSRNRYLTKPQRSRAVCISKALFEAADRVGRGEKDALKITQGIRDQMELAKFSGIDYIDVVDAQTLERVDVIDRPARICVAARVGDCRLIDNVGV